MLRLAYVLVVFFTMTPAFITTLCQKTATILSERAIETVM